MKKQCGWCGTSFKTYPSFNQMACSRSCAGLLKWRDAKYVQSMRDAHRGSVPWMKGRRHKMSSIILMRKAHYGGDKFRTSKQGYILEYKPDHPRAVNGRVPRQILVIEKYLGRMIRTNEIVHHKDGNKQNNRVTNLIVMDKTAHKKLHAKKIGFGTKVQSSPSRDRVNGKFMARAMKADAHVPGVRFYAEKIVVAGR